VPEWRILSDELWNAVAREAKSRRGRTAWKKGGTNRTAESRRYIFAGLLICGKCKRSFLAFRTARGGVRFACSGWRCGICSNNASILLSTVEADLLPAISERVRERSLCDELASDYRDQMVSRWNELVNSAQKAVDSADQLRESRRSLNRKADNIVDSLQDDGRNPLLVQRLKTIQEELAEIDEALKMAAEVVTPPLSEEQTRELVSRKLAELDAALTGPPEAVKHKLSKHIDGLLMKLVETPDGPRYEVTGEIRLFADGDPDDVLLAGSFQRSCKQYTPLSFPFHAILNPKVAPKRKGSDQSEIGMAVNEGSPPASVIAAVALVAVFAPCPAFTLRAQPRLTEAQAAALQIRHKGSLPINETAAGFRGQPLDGERVGANQSWLEGSFL